MAAAKGHILKYALLPGFIPRIFALATSGFGHLAYYVALIYAMVGLLPKNHAYLDPRNIGRFGIRHAIAAAANNLVFKRQNFDQILIFFTVLAGLVLLAVQLALLGIAFIAQQPAMAIGMTELFANPNSFTHSKGPQQDIAFILLDRVFGIVGLYDSCISDLTVECTDIRGNPIAGATPTSYPFPFHKALHTMLQFYSLGIFFIGALVLIYMTVTIVGETATTGTPFGQRFNKAWTPVRVILFFAMLIPINIGGDNQGLNGAQLITFWVVKQGSNFATNAWGYFNTQLSGQYFGFPDQSMVAMPNIPEVGNFNQFIMVERACEMIEKMEYGNDVKAWVVRPEPPAYIGTTADSPLSPTGARNAVEFLALDYDEALAFVYNGQITIRFGVLDVDKYADQMGHVFPFCGEIVLQPVDITEPGAFDIAFQYYEHFKGLWDSGLHHWDAKCMVTETIANEVHDPLCSESSSYIKGLDLAEMLNNDANATFKGAIEASILEQIDNGDFGVPNELLEKGWAGAAIWFNRIAKMNGAIAEAAFNFPRPNLYPYILEQTYERRLQENGNVSGLNRFSAELANGEQIRLPDNRQLYHAALYRVYRFWDTDALQNSKEIKPTGNVFIDTVNTILGTGGIFEMRKNADVHPMAQLTSLGRGMMEATVRNAAYATAGAVGKGVLGILDPLVAQALNIGSSFFFTVVTASIGISVILYYVLPFLPFIYFLFAISGWIKSIFEATVAMPLWALAHLQLDGEGIPGAGGTNGYFLLLEIFLRPILILFGLISSISIFGAMVTVLNGAFDQIAAVGGSDIILEGEIAQGTSSLPTSIGDLRGPVDEFFFTALYAILCYMIGLACFKLVDLIPNNILRWMGVSVATFQENAGDPASELTNQVYRGSILLTNQVRGATQGDLAAIVNPK